MFLMMILNLRGDCLITDLPSMIPLIKRNVKKNESSLKGNVEVKPYEWGTDLQLLSSSVANDFDIILVADCIYYKEVTLHKNSLQTPLKCSFHISFQSLDSLIQTLLGLLKRPLSNTKVEAYVSYEDRESEEKQRLVEKFLVEMKKECKVTPVPIDDYREDFKCDDIHILKLALH